jgi:Asp-tRNA(Asn)/Glu-tRNA(Gln) amidotransferase B subunit
MIYQDIFMADAKKHSKAKLNFVTAPEQILRVYQLLLHQSCKEWELALLSQKKLTDIFSYIISSEAFFAQINHLLLGDSIIYEYYNEILPQDDVKWLKSNFLPKAVNLKLSSAECSRLKLLRFMMVNETYQHCNLDSLEAQSRERFTQLIKIVADGKLTVQAVTKAHDDAMAVNMLAANQAIELDGLDFLIDATSFSAIKQQLGKTQQILVKSSVKNQQYLRKFGDFSVLEVLKKQIAEDNITAFNETLQALDENRDDIALILLANSLSKHSVPFAIYFSIMMAAIKSYVRRFMFVKAYDLLGELLASPEAGSVLNKKQLVEALKLKANTASRIGKPEVAEQIFSEIITRFPDDFEAHLSLGLIHMVESPAKAKVHLQFAARARRGVSRPMKLTVAEIFRTEGMTFEYQRLVFELMNSYGQHPETFILAQNMYLHENESHLRDASLNMFFESQNLMQPYVGGKDSANLFEISPNNNFLTQDNPLITVIMTTYNAEKTVRSAVKSVLAQTCQNIELYVIDDLSNDATRSILAELQAEDARVNVLLNSTNMGTYCSKNQAIEKANGEFITFHDSDDWMHPERLELNLKIMQNQQIAVCSSNWIRMDQFGFAIAQKHGGFIYRNPASTFFRRDALARLGYFDSVRTGADTEMYNRASAILGAESVVLLDACLAIGLHHSESLTQSGAGAIDGHRYSPVRVEYWQSFGEWHINCEKNNVAKMFLPISQKHRFFNAPDAIRAF